MSCSKRSLIDSDKELLPNEEGDIGCLCDNGEHAEGCEWIECTDLRCHVWYCCGWIMDELQLEKRELELLMASDTKFKCINHGFYDMNTEQIAEQVDMKKLLNGYQLRSNKKKQKLCGLNEIEGATNSNNAKPKPKPKPKHKKILSKKYKHKKKNTTKCEDVLLPQGEKHMIHNDQWKKIKDLKHNDLKKNDLTSDQLDYWNTIQKQNETLSNLNIQNKLPKKK
eukprot:26889_1